MGLSIKQETITPRKATEWLGLNTENRPLRHSYVATLSDALTAGEFQENGETIKFTESGKLVDGQHRLQAVIASGVSYRGIVVRGLDESAYITVDTGTPRGLKDVLARNRETNYTTLAVAVRAMLLLTSGRGLAGGGKMRIPIAMAVLAKFPQLRDAVQFCCDNELRSVCSVGYAAAMLVLCRSHDKEKADQFWSSVGIGDNLTKTSPAYVLRKRLLENKAATQGTPRLGRDQVIALCAKAWEAHLADKPLKVLRWSSQEAMPTFCKNGSKS